MDLKEINEKLLTPGLAHLPSHMDSKEARAMLLAIGQQESRFNHRRQIRGPARGFFQFEKFGGVAGVLSHRSTATHIRNVLRDLRYDDNVDTSYEAIEHNDHLAVCYARLFLWTYPGKLPTRNDYEGSWKQYIEVWRPGKPHRHTWDNFYAEAWRAV